MSEESCQDPSSISQFACKLYRMLQNNPQALQWRASLNGFVIRDIKILQSRVLPLYFRHSHYTSFVRQLNMYDFHKVRTQSQETLFCHAEFTRLSGDLLVNIKRKRQKKEDNDGDKENQNRVRFENRKKDPKELIDELVWEVRKQTDREDQARKLVYQFRKRPQFKTLAGTKYLTEIYARLNFQKDDLEELSIEEEIHTSDRQIVAPLKSLAFLHSELLLRKAGSTYFNIDDAELHNN